MGAAGPQMDVKCWGEAGAAEKMETRRRERVALGFMGSRRLLTCESGGNLRIDNRSLRVNLCGAAQGAV